VSSSKCINTFTWARGSQENQNNGEENLNTLIQNKVFTIAGYLSSFLVKETPI
jgi:hypothetical protein